MLTCAGLTVKCLVTALITATATVEGVAAILEKPSRWYSLHTIMCQNVCASRIWWISIKYTIKLIFPRLWNFMISSVNHNSSQFNFIKYFLIPSRLISPSLSVVVDNLQSVYYIFFELWEHIYYIFTLDKKTIRVRWKNIDLYVFCTTGAEVVVTTIFYWPNIS
jgi:hypothetical protein